MDDGYTSDNESKHSAQSGGRMYGFEDLVDLGKENAAVSSSFSTADFLYRFNRQRYNFYMQFVNQIINEPDLKTLKAVYGIERLTRVNRERVEEMKIKLVDAVHFLTTVGIGDEKTKTSGQTETRKQQVKRLLNRVNTELAKIPVVEGTTLDQLPSDPIFDKAEDLRRETEHTRKLKVQQEEAKFLGDFKVNASKHVEKIKLRLTPLAAEVRDNKQYSTKEIKNIVGQLKHEKFTDYPEIQRLIYLVDEPDLMNTGKALLETVNGVQKGGTGTLDPGPLTSYPVDENNNISGTEPVVRVEPAAPLPPPIEPVAPEQKQLQRQDATVAKGKAHQGALIAQLSQNRPDAAEPVAATAEPATAEPVAATAEPVAATVEPVAATVEPVAATVEPEPEPVKKSWLSSLSFWGPKKPKSTDEPSENYVPTVVQPALISSKEAVTFKTLKEITDALTTTLTESSSEPQTYTLDSIKAKLAQTQRSDITPDEKESKIEKLEGHLKVLQFLKLAEASFKLKSVLLRFLQVFSIIKKLTLENATFKEELKKISEEAGLAADELEEDALIEELVILTQKRLLPLENPNYTIPNPPVKEKTQSGGEETFYEKLLNRATQVNNDWFDGDVQQKNEAKNQIVFELEKDSLHSPANGAITVTDRIVIVSTLFAIRSLAIYIVDWAISIQMIKNFKTAFIFYSGMYTLLFVMLCVLVNTHDQLFFRLLFYYLSTDNGWTRIILHIVIQVLLLPIPFLVYDKRKTKGNTTSSEVLTFTQRRSLMHSIDLFSLFIWIFVAFITIVY